MKIFNVTSIKSTRGECEKAEGWTFNLFSCLEMLIMPALLLMDLEGSHLHQPCLLLISASHSPLPSLTCARVGMIQWFLKTFGGVAVCPNFFLFFSFSFLFGVWSGGENLGEHCTQLNSVCKIPIDFSLSYRHILCVSGYECCVHPFECMFLCLYICSLFSFMMVVFFW